jgi:ketosteroid isomerase-like protein
MNSIRLFAIIPMFVAFAVPDLRADDTAPVQSAVRAVLDQQVKDWNAGDIEKFMRGYDRSEKTRFASGGNITLGWQAVMDRYRRTYSDKAAMGTLTFSDLDITVASEDSALAFGRWHLKREKDEPSGLFTLLFRKTPAGWKIVHDHTSAAEKK